MHVDPLVELVPGLVAPGTAALDCGCGRGQHAVYLAAAGISVFAFDQPGPSLTRLQQFAAQNAVRINFFAADLATHMPEAAAYHAVLAIKVLHLFAPVTSDLVISRLRAATAPGGIAVVTAFEPTARLREAFPARVASGTFLAADALRSRFPGWEVVHETAEDYELDQRAPDGSAVVARKIGLLVRRPR
jgi:2-polyprenyl-3-methyl-5-hydroxy-6-metoxy-1,4-benzoquinol methylase